MTTKGMLCTSTVNERVDAADLTRHWQSVAQCSGSSPSADTFERPSRTIPGPFSRLSSLPRSALSALDRAGACAVAIDFQNQAASRAAATIATLRRRIARIVVGEWRSSIAGTNFSMLFSATRRRHTDDLSPKHRRSRLQTLNDRCALPVKLRSATAAVGCAQTTRKKFSTACRDIIERESRREKNP